MADTPWLERARVESRYLGTGGRAALAGVGLFLAGLYANWVVRVLGLAGSANVLAEAGMIVGALSLVAGAVARSARPPTRARVRVANDALEVQREGALLERVPLGDLASGVILPSGDRPRLELLKRGGDLLSIELEEPDDGALEAVLDAAGLDPSRRAFRQRTDGWRSPGLLAAGAAFGLTFLFVSIAKAALAGVHVGPAADLAIRGAVLAVVVLVSWVVARFARGTELVVGADGLTVTGAGRARFVPFGQISRVDDEAGALMATLESGERLSLGRSTDPTRSRAVIQQIERARAAGSGATASRTRLQALDRGGRSLAEWREALATIASTTSTYRAARIERTDLYELLADASAPEGRRVGAALALTHGGDAEGRGKVRAAAAACANERVRVALERIAEGEDEDAAVEEATAAEAEAEASRAV